MTVIAIIPARGGSRRIAGKNKRLFHGKPIIAYSIQAAIDSKVFNHIYVSTDDDEIRAIAEQYGAHWWRRQPGYERDEIGTQELMQRTMLDMLTRGHQITEACCIYPCAPMLHPGTLVRAHLELMDSKVSYVVPVGEWLQDPGMFYFGRASAFRMGSPLIGFGTRLLQVDPNRCCDINTEEDWQRASAMYAALHQEQAA